MCVRDTLEMLWRMCTMGWVWMVRVTNWMDGERCAKGYREGYYGVGQDGVKVAA